MRYFSVDVSVAESKSVILGHDIETIWYLVVTLRVLKHSLKHSIY